MNKLVLKTVSVVAVSAMMLAAPALANGNKPAGGNNGNGNGNSSNSSSNGKGNNHGATASSLGALNAAHANQNAFDNASENSRIGRIRTYMEAAGAAETAEAALAEILAGFEGFESGFATAEEFEAAFEADPTGLEEEAAYWAAVAEAAEAEAALEVLKAAAETALGAAGNKEITPEVIEELWVLLEGIELADPAAEPAAE